MGADTQSTVSDLTAELGKINLEALDKFSGLSFEQINWKASPESWSIGQVFDHLIVSHSGYLPIIDSIVSGKKESNFFQYLPILPGLTGKMLLKFLDPAKAKQVPAPKPFLPSSSEIDNQVVERFVDLQRRLMDAMRRTEGLNTRKIIISSPAAKAMVYSLFDAYRIIVTHDWRHLGQATRVMGSPGFPAN